MNATLNYIIEANIGLALFLGCYHFILKDETRFRLLRIFLITGIAASLIFPVIDVDFNAQTTPLSISRVVPSYWLPEVVVGDEGVASAPPNTPGFWEYATIIYFAGLVLALLYTVVQLMQLSAIIRQTTTYRIHNLRVAESNEDKPIFSFFNFIFIGNAHLLSEDEKQQVISHESVHVRQWHPFDILLINVVKIVFWFNPLINQYKKSFIQLHEFEADARAVENSDVNKYCSLLARVALKSADYTLANHFNNSLTVKRIEMIRSIKYKIRRWKLLAIATVLPATFFIIACQDQVGDDVMAITKNSSHALIIPEPVQNRFEQLQKENPGKTFAVLELNETASQKISDLESRYGLPSSIEVFTTKDGRVVEQVHGGSQSKIVMRDTQAQASKKDEQTFAIIQFTEETSKLSEAAAQDEKVFTVVQEQPEFRGGYDSMMTFLRQNLRYPQEARIKGLEGTVYVSFIVETDGSVTNAFIIRGIEESVDAEAKRVVEMFPPWIPGKQNNQSVRVRFVIPIKFKIG